MIEDFRQDPKIKQVAAQLGMPYEQAEKVMLQNGYKTPPLSFKDLRAAKKKVQGTDGQDGLINWNRLPSADIPIEEQFHRALATELRSGEEQGADAIEKSYYGDKSNQFQTLKDKFGNLATAKQITGNKADAQRANQILGLKDSIYGGTLGTLGGLVGHQSDRPGRYDNAILGAGLGAVGALGNKVARDYGSQISATALNNLSKLAAKSPVLKTILLKNPTLAPQILKLLGPDANP